MHKLLLDNYIPGGFLKVVAIYLCLGFTLGFFSRLGQLYDPYQLLICLLFLVGVILLLIVIFGKKALLISDDNLYVCLIVFSKVVFKKEFKKSNFTEYKVIEKEKTDLPFLFKYSILDLFSSNNALVVYLTNDKSEKYYGLVAVSDAKFQPKIEEFLQRWTNLKEKNSG